MLRRLLLVAAFVFCSIGIFGLLSNGNQPRPTQPPEPQKKQVQVWRAHRDLSTGEPVHQRALESALVSEDDLPDRQEDKPLLTLKPGAIARETISAGTLVTDQLLVAPGDTDYIDHLIKPGMIPYPLTINGSSYQTVLTPGDRVDVVIISSLEQNLAHTSVLSNYRGLSIGPLLSELRVLSVSDDALLDTDSKDSTVILELSRDQVSKLLIARRIGVLDIHKSTGELLPIVRTGDVLPGYSSVTELRGSDRLIN